MPAHLSGPDQLDPKTQAFYRQALQVLSREGPPFLLGGAYAFGLYTGITRHTKDLDVFVRPEDRDRALKVLAGAGYRTQVTYPHWLAKAYAGDDFLDVIYHSGNGVATVTDEWFQYAPEGELLGEVVRLCPVEETLLTKAFIMERDRYDGADVAHLLRAVGDRLDWPRLLRLFDQHWRVLVSHLVLFDFIYPSERARIPEPVRAELLERLRDDVGKPPAPAERLCRGTLLGATQYQVDVKKWGYQDGRLQPWGNMTREEVAHWEKVMEEGEKPPP